VLDRIAGHGGGDSPPTRPALGRRTVNAAVATDKQPAAKI